MADPTTSLFQYKSPRPQYQVLLHHVHASRSAQSQQPTTTRPHVMPVENKSSAAGGSSTRVVGLGGVEGSHHLLCVHVIVVAVLPHVGLLRLCVLAHNILCNHAPLPVGVEGVPILRGLGEVWAVSERQKRHAGSQAGRAQPYEKLVLPWRSQKQLAAAKSPEGCHHMPQCLQATAFDPSKYYPRTWRLLGQALTKHRDDAGQRHVQASTPHHLCLKCLCI